jgi:hypothetical protein
MRTFKSLLITFSGENNQDIKSDWKDAMSDYGLEYSKRLCDNYFFKYGKSYIEAVFEEVANNIEYIYIHQVNGQICEFGTGYGVSANIISSLNGKFSQIINFSVKDLYLFDSFEGLPEYWRPGFNTGTFKTEGLPAVPANVTLVPGWFDRSLPAFLDAHPDQPVSFLHIDCDLYSSTQTVLAQLKDRIIAGTVIVFDEYLNYPGWQHHEHKAFSEFIASTGRAYEWIGLVPSYEQAAIRILN